MDTFTGIAEYIFFIGTCVFLILVFVLVLFMSFIEMFIQSFFPIIWVTVICLAYVNFLVLLSYVMVKFTSCIGAGSAVINSANFIMNNKNKDALAFIIYPSVFLIAKIEKFLKSKS